MMKNAASAVVIPSDPAMCSDATPKFSINEIVEQTNLGDIPFMVVSVEAGTIHRYEISGIDGSTYSNIPEYMLVKARPPEQSKWGADK